MIYCINPECKHRPNHDDSTSCATCGTPLLVRNRYRLIRPLRKLDRRLATEIFEVEDIKYNHRRKVLKILKDNEPKLVEKFEEEALTLQWLDHPGIPQVDIDGYFQLTIDENSEPLSCLVMEKIEGEDLEKWSATHGPISQKMAIDWLRQILEILKVLHENKFLHRDIKPANIILKSNGQLVLIDFGSVREISPTYRLDVRLGSVTTYISSGYTAPEQIEGKALPESDFFAVGRTFVHLVTGLHPVDLPRDGKTGQLIWRHKAPQISSPLADFIDDLMAPDPAARPQNIQGMLRNLTVRGLWLRSVWRWINSWQFKLAFYSILLILIASLVIYRLSFKVQAQYFSEAGRQALRAGKLDIAKQNLTQAIERNPYNANYHNDLGLVCKYQQNWYCAEQHYRKALKLNPQDGTIYYNLADLYEDVGDWETALKYYELAIKYKHNEIEYYAINNLARLQIIHQHNDQLAIQLLTDVLKKSDAPEDLKPRLYKNLGWAYFQAGENAAAEQALRAAIRLDRQNSAAPHCLLAKILQAQKDEEAIAAWKHCRDNESDSYLLEVKMWKLDAHRYLTTETTQGVQR